jgi:iron complex transport system substrate-binding protein
VYSCPPIDDLIRARIDSARHMLLYTDQTISSIAEAVGYANQTHFIRQFKQYTGSTPGQYRREFKNM